MRLNTDPKRLTQRTAEEKLDLVLNFMEECAFILNGNIEPIGNLKVEMYRVQFTFTNVEQDIRHKLGRVAKGYFVIRKSGNFNVYDGATDWNANSVFLKASAAGFATVLVF